MEGGGRERGPRVSCIISMAPFYVPTLYHNISSLINFNFVSGKEEWDRTDNSATNLPAMTFRREKAKSSNKCIFNEELYEFVVVVINVVVKGSYTLDIFARDIAILR